MRRLSALGVMLIIGSFYNRPANAKVLVAEWAREAVTQIFSAAKQGGRAPLLFLNAQMAHGCMDAIKALETEARQITDVYSADTADILSVRSAEAIFNYPPTLHQTAPKTPLEEFLEAKPYGGLLMFWSHVAHENVIPAARVAEMIKLGKHVSQAGQFKTSRHAIVLQAGDKVSVARQGNLRSTLPPSLWSGTINYCRYDLVDGDAFASRLAAEDRPTEVKAADAEPTDREFAEDIVTRIGRASQLLMLPPLVLLTPVGGQSCGPLASMIHEVAKDVLPAYNIFATDAQAFAHKSFRDFVSQNTRGMILTRASGVKMQTETTTAQVGKLILSQWLDGPQGGYAMDRFSYVVDTTTEAELLPGLKVESLLNKAHAARESRGCRFSLLPGVAILTLLKEHKRCTPALTAAEG